MSDVKIIVILNLFHSGCFRCLKHYYKEYVCKHLTHLFPKRVSHNRFCEIGERVPIAADGFHQGALAGYLYRHQFVDSTPLCVCRNQRILIHKTFKGLA